MINGVKDAIPRGLDRTPPGKKAEKPDKPDKDSFLDRLGGADRTEREIKPGREDRLIKTTREGKRSAESDPSSTKSVGDKQSEKLASPKPAKNRPDAERKSLAQKDAKKAPGLEPNAQATASTIQQRPAPLAKAMPGPQIEEANSSVEGTSTAADLKRIDVKSERASSSGSGRATESDDVASFDDDLPGIDARKAAMQDFLQGMQREFGIAPEKIVEAFNKMDEKTLMAAPEAATKQFVQNLDLAPGAAQSRATEMYQQMVQTTGEALVKDAKPQAAGVSIEDDALDAAEEALLKLDDKLDELSQGLEAAFADPAEVPADGANAPIKAQYAAEKREAQLARMMRDPNSKSEAAKDLPTDHSKAPIAAPIVAPITGAPKTEAAAPAKALVDTTAADASAASATSVASKAGLAGFNSSGAGGMESGAGNSGGSATADAQAAMQTASSSTKSASDSTTAFASAMKNETAAKAKRTTEPKTESVKDDSSLTNDAALSRTARLNDLAKDSSPLPAGFEAALANGPAPTPDDQANVKELLRQAQVVLKKGGGEIKMDLKPENGADGIGEVRLKVSVENGQVSIQMTTDSDESKRLLEKSLHELKADLASHSLKMEHMKVDVGTELQKHMDKQGDESARDQSRQAAQDFMGQMRDERQAMRQGFMENTGWKSYNQGGRRSAVNPETTSIASTANAKSVGSSARPGVSGSGRLNLVA